MGAELAIAGLATSGLGMLTGGIAQDKMNKEMSKANAAAKRAAEENRKAIEAEKAAEEKKRRELIDEQRLQLGAGLGQVMSTRYMTSGASTQQTNILG